MTEHEVSSHKAQGGGGGGVVRGRGLNYPPPVPCIPGYPPTRNVYRLILLFLAFFPFSFPFPSGSRHLWNPSLLPPPTDLPGTDIEFLEKLVGAGVWERATRENF